MRKWLPGRPFPHSRRGRGIPRFIGWIIIGGLAGWVASKIMNTDAQQGITLNIVVGIIGALIGGWLLSLADIDGNSGLIVSFLRALLGACLLLFRGQGRHAARLTTRARPLAVDRREHAVSLVEAACSPARADFGAGHRLR